MIELPWTRQPPGVVQLDTRHSLYKGLRFFVYFPGVALEAVTGSIGVLNGAGYVSNNLTTVRGGGRSAALASATSDFYEFPANPNYNITESITLAWRGQINTGSAFRHFAGKHLSNGAADNPFDFRTDNAANPVPTVVRANATTSRSIFPSGLAIPLAIPATVEFKQGPLISNDGIFYVNGIREAVPGSAPTTATTTNTATLRVGRRADGSVQMDGYTQYIAGWARELTEAELISFRANPWQLFEPRRIYVRVVSAPAGLSANPVRGGGAAINPIWGMVA